MLSAVRSTEGAWTGNEIRHGGMAGRAAMADSTAMTYHAWYGLRVLKTEAGRAIDVQVVEAEITATEKDREGLGEDEGLIVIAPKCAIEEKLDGGRCGSTRHKECCCYPRAPCK